MALDLHHDFTLNPDGSGRVQVRWSGPLGDDVPPADEFVRAEIERARGVEVWGDVRCAPENDSMVFTGTAWFRDVAALRFHCQGLHVNVVDLELCAEPNGSVEVHTRLERTAGDAAGTTAPVDLASERAKLTAAREFIAGMFGQLTCTVVVRLPGRIAGAVRGRQKGADTVEVTLRGERLVALLDRLLVDDTLMQRVLDAGGLNGPQILFELLGDDVTLAARTQPGARPQFDFEQEVAAARPAFDEFVASLRVAAPDAGPAVPLANVRVVAARVVREADGTRDLCPQGQSDAGVTLTVAADLPQRALSLDRALLERAITDDGTDITPPEEWDRQCHFPKATADGSTIYLDLALRPGEHARGVTELTARVTATTSEGSEVVDLGLSTLTVGATGTTAGVEVLRCEDEPDGGTLLELRFRLPRAHILGLELAVGDGGMPLSIQGSSSCNDECSLTCRVEGALPEGARVLATLATGLMRTDYSLALHDVDWLGRSL